jgi:hypothetical protein
VTVKKDKKHSAPNIDLNAAPLILQQEGWQQVKNNPYNPKSTYHIPTKGNGRVTLSVHKKKSVLWFQQLK